MPLQYQLDSVEGLDDSVKALYTEKEGKFVLAIDGLPEPPKGDEGLADRIRKLEENNKSLLEEKRKAKEAAEAAALEAAKKSGDVEALEKSWQEKVNATASEKEAVIKQYEQMVHALTAGSTATKLAAELAVPGSADVLLPHIQARLTVESKDGKPTTRVLDKDGKPSAMTVDDLAKEIAGNPAFAPIIAATKAKGAGFKANGGSGHQSLYRDEMTLQQKADFQKENGRDAFLKLPKARPSS